MVSFFLSQPIAHFLDHPAMAKTDPFDTGEAAWELSACELVKSPRECQDLVYSRKDARSEIEARRVARHYLLAQIGFEPANLQRVGQYRD